jgi:hypothetical protein
MEHIAKSDGEDTQPRIVGQFEAGGVAWRYAEREAGEFELWPLSEEVSVRMIGKRSFGTVLQVRAVVEDDGGSVPSIVGSSWQQKHRSCARRVAAGSRLKSAVSLS